MTARQDSLLAAARRLLHDSETNDTDRARIAAAAVQAATGMTYENARHLVDRVANVKRMEIDDAEVLRRLNGSFTRMADSGVWKWA